ncbi:hypothetical protein CCR85_11860 [Rhodothalassium salexigens]|uniref:capsule assembly Wzi family protein n=1 Tax=Rhodothalassium salexigens TaxID=1086 RepID=UPI001911C997|nr:capsule assembly Wzi family protein [Rhodothalassium salexigens]MBK5912184.1 hypothetical protein [Rhodothalassium salexigens]
MTQASFARRLAACCLTALLFVAAAVPPADAASPWIDPGDRLLRRDIELLKAHGIVDGPIATWPLSWKQIQRSLSQAEERLDRPDVPAHVRMAVERVKLQMPQVQDYRSFDTIASAGFTNQQRLVRDFGGGARSDADLRVGIEGMAGRFFLRASAGYRTDNPTGRDWHFDDSVGAVALGNWLFYGGTVNQWYGPGMDSALVLSTNARPSPRLGFQRLDPKAIDLPVLRWLGPLQFTFSASRAEDDRDDFDHPLMFHTRLSIEPVDGFTLGLSRGLQLCGEGRRCSFSTIAKGLGAITPFTDDLDNTGDVFDPDEPGNQIFGIDMAYADTWGDYDYKVYLESAAEDSAGPVMFGAATLTLGGHLSGYWTDRGLSWKLRGEVSETQTNRFFGIGKDDRFGVAYNNFVFTEGYTYRDRYMGPSIGGDGRLFTGELSLVDLDSRFYYLRYRHIVLNGTGVEPRNALKPPRDRLQYANRLSRNPERINSIAAGVTLPPTRYGRLTLEARLFDDKPNTPDRSPIDGAFELRWTYGF